MFLFQMKIKNKLFFKISKNKPLSFLEKAIQKNLFLILECNFCPYHK